MEAMSFDQWKDIKEEPLPGRGRFVVSVQSHHNNGSVTAFADIVPVEDGRPMDRFGDDYVYIDEITHWQPLVLPNPVLPVVYN
ncbi:MAG: hypothetical protein EOO39_39810 [Cytophagaceae bacterium]|nr:MAG: hypothetical protein EOO39_39810 [Cytophagaceae bacterium]